MTVDINSLEESFKDLTKYSDAQFHTVNKLKEEIEKLKSENKSLQSMIAGNLPSLEFRAPHLGISNEQMICETQISILKERAIIKELNADEVRRFCQLFEVLEKIKGSAVNIDDITVNKMSDAELLKLVVVNDNAGK